MRELWERLLVLIATAYPVVPLTQKKGADKGTAVQLAPLVYYREKLKVKMQNIRQGTSDQAQCVGGRPVCEVISAVLAIVLTRQGCGAGTDSAGCGSEMVEPIWLHVR